MPTTMVKNPTSTSNNMSTQSKIGAASSIAGSISSVGAAYSQKLAYDVQSIQAETAAKRAKLQGNLDSLQLSKNYNKTQAFNAVMAAAQGRRGASVQAVRSAAEEQLNWDKTFMEISSDISYNQALANASGFKSAGQVGMGFGLAGAGVDTLNTTAKLYSIGGSTKKETKEGKE